MTTTIISLVYLTILLTLAIGAYKWLKHLAAEDMLFVCKVPLNEAVGIRRGGAFQRFLFDPTGGTHLNDPRSWQFLRTFRAWERIPNSYPADHSLAGKMHPNFVYKDERNWVTRFTGLYFFWPWLEEVDKYEFTWSVYLGTTVNNGVPEHNIKLREKKLVRSFYAKVTQYHWRVAATTQDNQTVLGDFTFDLDGINPFVARFDRDNFLGHVQSLIEAELRNYVGRQTISDLLSEDDADGRAKFYETQIKDKDNHVRESYGVSIKAVHILSFKGPPGPASELMTARIAAQAAVERTKAVAQEAQQALLRGNADNAVKQGAADVEVNKARALMQIRTGNAAATKVAVAETLFAGAKVVSVGAGGLNTLINLADLDALAPTTTATAPASTGAAAPTATPARAGRTTP